MRCPYCHNRDLVLNPGAIPEVKVEEVLTHLEQNPLCWMAFVSPGPTLQENLLDFLLRSKVKLKNKIGYKRNQAGSCR